MPESGSDPSEKSAGGRCHTQYWFLRSRGCPPAPGGCLSFKVVSEGLEPASEVARWAWWKSLELRPKAGGIPPPTRGGSERCVPELSDSQSGITRNAGREGGMLEEGEVSRDLELSSQESESDILAPCGDNGRPGW